MSIKGQINKKFFKSAVLFKNNKPLKIIKLNFKKPEKNQVLVKINYSGFCSSQYGEIIGIKGKDKFLPHCLGHEAFGKITDVGSGVTKVKKNDQVVLHWMKSSGSDCRKIHYKSERGLSINSGKITTFSYFTLVSQNRVTKIPKNKYSPKILPLMGCSISVGISTLEKIAKIRRDKNILILGSGALGLPMIHYCKHEGLKNIEILEQNMLAAKKATNFGATKVYNSLDNSKLKYNLSRNFYDYICDTTGSSKLITSILGFPIFCKFIFLGVPRFNEKFKVNSLKINYGLKLLGSYGGNFNPQKDLVRYLNLLKKTKFNFRDYIYKVYNFNKINNLIKDYKKNKVIGKALIKFN